MVSQGEIDAFVELGYCAVREAFSPEVARRCRRAVWKHIEQQGITEEDPSTWSRAPKGRLGLAEIFRDSDLGAPWSECWSPRLREAIDQVCGAGKWEPNGCGWWVVTFPEDNAEPWGVRGNWHVDGHGYRHLAQSREVGLVLLMLFSDVGPNGGGTALAPNSHRVVAEKLLRAGADGLAGPALSAATRAAVDLDNPVEARGRAGDVFLLHPFLLHARSKNLSGHVVRFLCHPVLALREPLRLFPRPADPTPVERVALDVLDHLPPPHVLPSPPPPGGDSPRLPPRDNTIAAVMGFDAFARQRSGNLRARKKRKSRRPSRPSSEKR
ncbi:hypothetical protein CTAYLR_003734 [Chrysophaeum taylorii]|uniref:Phytanoyl-CoA dioxygenase n=1 Tax=Chrysophaeum taylorii TaxID=2483200 RepID=A0AAD7XTQ9_9STRA|nr:hypothetical protein CTAYLR_003734 [Chrysophaeum taylorii]